MNKVKLLVCMLAISTTLGTAHAAQVMDAKCADESNGMFGETALHETVICSNGKWADAKTLTAASVEIEKYSEAKNLEASYQHKAYVGTQSFQRSSGEHGPFTLIANVAAVNPDNTAHVVIDLSDSDWRKHVDATVPLASATEIATDSQGAKYFLTVKPNP